MLLNEILQGLQLSDHNWIQSNPGLLQKPVTLVTQDTRQVIADSIFVAIQGHSQDGHQFLSEAAQKGAVALIVEEAVYQNKEIQLNLKMYLSKNPELRPVIVQVKNSREALDYLASAFYAYPSQDLFCVGVTGTNGKTSITYMTECILNSAGLATGVIGTVNHHLKDKVWPSHMTTPDSVNLQKRLAEFKSAGAKALAIEVSSHALHQHRVNSVQFDVAIFTNLTRDHLDYHQSMDEYFEAKQLLFVERLANSKKKQKFAIIHSDDPYGMRLRVAEGVKVYYYGQYKKKNLRQTLLMKISSLFVRNKAQCFSYHIKRVALNQTHVKIRTPVGKAYMHLPMVGHHNVQNALAAIAVGIAAGVSLQQCVGALEKFTGVPGRLQLVPNRLGRPVLVDYAHSPDALENVLTALTKIRNQVQRQQNTHIRLVTVFGCGGDRDKGKRPQMMDIALRFSDCVIVTSDNPRTENPEQIIRDIVGHVDENTMSQKVLVESDRKKAIQLALQKTGSEDIILIAGKGHEDYQIIGTEKKYFSDVATVLEELK